jgi:hypothetical protein
MDSIIIKNKVINTIRDKISGVIRKTVKDISNSKGIKIKLMLRSIFVFF